jgi:hypothetical protein
MAVKEKSISFNIDSAETKKIKKNHLKLLRLCLCKL